MFDHVFYKTCKVSMDSAMGELAQNGKLMASLFVAIICYIFILYSAICVGVDRFDKHFNLISVVMGTAFGWISGFLLAPYPDEAKEFAKYSALIYTFISGYLVAKTDGLISKILSPDFVLNLNRQIVLRISLFVSSAMIAAIVTYVFRKYMDNATIPF